MKELTFDKAPYIYPCKFCKGLGKHYRMSKLEICFCCKGDGVDRECYSVNKHRLDGVLIQ